MQKILWLCITLCCTKTIAQKPIVKNRFTDSGILALKYEYAGDLPVTSISENERVTTLPSPLHANRDVFMNMAGFHFSVTRFRLRGLDAGNFDTEFNGVPMNSAEEGTTPWGLWSGLTDVTKNTQSTIGLNASDFSFGSLGNATKIDTRASRQRVQTQVGYAFSNRSFTHRWSFTHSTGAGKKGWAFTFSGSFRYAAEGYAPGSFYNGKSYFLAADKKLGTRSAISVNIFGAPTVSGKQSAVTQEIRSLLDNAVYNAYWGYQSGNKRNANTRATHQPVLIVRYDWQPANRTTWTTAFAITAGERSDSGLDWYKAADPRPDYYRYLPSYQPDSLLRNTVAASIKKDPGLLQINWLRMHETNRNSNETIPDANGTRGNSLSGRRSHYIIENRVAAIQRFIMNSALQLFPLENTAVSAGCSFQLQRTHNYKEIGDLLGGDFYVDWNQFAERDFPNDADAMQNDLRRPNRILSRKDRYGYNYYVHTLSGTAWAQLAATGKKLDYFAAVELKYTNYKREGLVANGLFPRNSLGSSMLYEFTGQAAKTGIVYKINGRRYLYASLGYFLKAPLFDNVFIAPRIHNQTQEKVQAEKVFSAESGYIWNTPLVKLRISGYFISFANGMNIMSFYHDGFGNFVNYALSGIGKMHGGLELGANISFSEKLSMDLALATARYYYTTRQQLTVTADNNASVIERGMIYSKGFRIDGTPQECYGITLHYQSSSFYCSITGSYFRQQWLAFNPLRRTPEAVSGLDENSPQRKKIIDQLSLPDQYCIDLAIGGSVRIKIPGATKRKTLSFYGGINNLLDKKDLISGGYEQLRFDTDNKNTDKFPPKYFYAMGINFSVNLALRI